MKIKVSKTARSYLVLPALMLVILTCITMPIFSQNIDTTNLSLDNRLYNGKYYTYFPPKEVLGIQFLSQKSFSKGTVWINGLEFKNSDINYDVYNQELVLRFVTRDQANRIISVSLLSLDSFTFENKIFIIEHFENDRHIIYQQIKLGELTLLIHWYKRLELSTSLNSTQYFFTDIQRKTILQKSKKEYQLTTNKSLLKILSKKQSASLRKYLKSNHLKLNNMSDLQYYNLLVFLNQLNHE